MALNNVQASKWRKIEARFGLPFWDVVRACRDEGLTKQQTARRIGYGPQNFYRLMNSRQVPSDLRGWRVGVGDTHPYARLRSEDIPLIRQLHAEGLSKGEIARKFEVSRNAIHDVISYRTWWHVQEAA